MEQKEIVFEKLVLIMRKALKLEIAGDIKDIKSLVR
jgi:hypothetical protein